MVAPTGSIVCSCNTLHLINARNYYLSDRLTAGRTEYCLWSCLTDAVRSDAVALARPISRHVSGRNKILSRRRRYVSPEKSGRDGQNSATCVLFRECHLSLPWACIRGASLLQCLGAWGGVVPYRQRRCGLCGVASALAPLCRSILGTTTRPARVGRRARSDECLLLSGDLPHSLRNGWSYRVPWPYHTRCTRRTDPTEHWRTASGSRRRMALDGCPLRRTGAGVCVRFCQLCLLHALRGTRPSDRPGWRRSRHRSAGSSDVRRFPDHYPHWDQRGLARDQQATAAPRRHRCRYLFVGHPVCE